MEMVRGMSFDFSVVMGRASSANGLLFATAVRSSSTDAWPIMVSACFRATCKS